MPVFISAFNVVLAHKGMNIPSKRKLEIYAQSQNQLLTRPFVLLAGHVDGYFPFIKIFIILCHSGPVNFDL